MHYAKHRPCRIVIVSSIILNRNEKEKENIKIGCDDVARSSLQLCQEWKPIGHVLWGVADSLSYRRFD
jgi:hypothetical protein